LELYCGSDLPEHVVDCIRNSSDVLLEDLRLWNKDIEGIVEHIKQGVLDSTIYVAYQDNICLLFLDKTPYTFHMFILMGSDYKANKLTRIIKEVFTIFNEKTPMHKMELATTCPEMHPLLTKIGFNLEGTLVDSRKVDDTFVDEWVYGYLIDVS